MNDVSAAVAMLRALARPERLNLLVALGAEPVGIGELVERTGLPLASLSKELVRLESAGLVRNERGTVTARAEAMSHLADALERSLPITEIAERHGVERYFRNGMLAAIPVDASSQAQVAAAIAELIPHDATFTEAEVNEMLAPVFADHATLRRLLVDEGLLARGAGVDYRRTREPAMAHG